MILVKVMTGTPFDDALERAIEVRRAVVEANIKENVFLSYVDLEIEITNDSKLNLMEEAFGVIKSKYFNEKIPSGGYMGLTNQKHWMDNIVEPKDKEDEEEDDLPF